MTAVMQSPNAKSVGGDESPDGLPVPPNHEADRTSALQNCSILTHLKKGELHAITKANVQELFDVLSGDDEREYLSKKDLKLLLEVKELNLTVEDIDNLAADCDKDKNGKISSDELYKALIQGSLVQKQVLSALGKGPKTLKPHECHREQLLDFLHHEQATSEALWSLPSTLFLFFVFMLVSSLHLEIGTGFEMQNGIRGAIDGEGLPYLFSSVNDVPTFWAWMKTSWINVQFKSSEEFLPVYPYPGRLASYNQMVGGMQLKKTFTAPSQCQQSDMLVAVYDSYRGGRCHKVGAKMTANEYFLYHEKKEELLAHIMRLESDVWIDHNTTQVDFTALFYNAHLGAFTTFHLLFTFPPSGELKIVYRMETYAADPYGSKWIIGLDIIFVFLLGRTAYSEVKEMIPRMMNGLDGFIQYWEFWNFIDWLSIVFGSVCIVLWGLICSKVGVDLQEKILVLPQAELDMHVLANQTFLEADEISDVIGLEDYYARIDAVSLVANDVMNLHWYLRVLVFFYAAVLMMKFFKAYRANPRLDIVVQTITTASVDIVHFGIVFVTIFLVFATMAYVVFGPKVKQFSNLYRASCMCWRVLLGDFQMDELDDVDFLLANFWFFSFQTLVMLILLNMLLAIIMDNYQGVKSKTKDPVTIWRQLKVAVDTLRETRGHLKLLYLICELEDEDDKAHPQEKVTTKSLRKAFERDKMTTNQAKYLLEKTAQYLEEKEGETDLRMHDAVRIIAQVQTMVNKTQYQAEKMMEMMLKKEREPQDRRYDAILAGLDPDDPSNLMMAQNGDPDLLRQSAAFGDHQLALGGSVLGVPLDNQAGVQGYPPGAPLGMPLLPGVMPARHPTATTSGVAPQLTAPGFVHQWMPRHQRDRHDAQTSSRMGHARGTAR